MDGICEIIPSQKGNYKNVRGKKKGSFHCNCCIYFSEFIFKLQLRKQFYYCKRLYKYKKLNNKCNKKYSNKKILNKCYNKINT